MKEETPSGAGEAYQEGPAWFATKLQTAKLQLQEAESAFLSLERADRPQWESWSFIQRIADAAPNILYVYDLKEQRCIYINNHVSRIIGYTPDDIREIGPAAIRQMLHPDDHRSVIAHFRKLLAAGDGKVLENEYRIKHFDGRWRWLRSKDVIFTRGSDGSAERFLGMVEDITEHKQAKSELKKANRRLRRLAAIDQLTHLPNRRWFTEVLERNLRRIQRYGGALTLAMLDVDNFKAMNDAFGHAFGDRVLKKIAGMLRAGARRSDIVARYAGDEFVVLMPETSIEAAVVAVERLKAKIADNTISDGKRSIQSTISVGISSTGPNAFATIEDLVRLADKALYAAKDAGRNCVRTDRLVLQKEKVA